MKKIYFLIFLITGCATIPQIESTNGWSLNGPQEARDFYSSGKSMSDFFLEKRKSSSPLHTQSTQSNSFQLCWAFFDLNDYISASECLQQFNQLSFDTLSSYKTANDTDKYPDRLKGFMPYYTAHFIKQSELLNTRFQEFNLEQGKYAEVIKELEPIFKRKASMVDYSVEQNEKHAFNLQAISTNTLIAAYRALGQTPPEHAFAYVNGPSYSQMQRMTVTTGGKRSSLLMEANRAVVLGDYAKCASLLKGESLNAANDFGQKGNGLLDLFYSGAGTAIATHTNREVLRLEGNCAYLAENHEQAKDAYEAVLLADTKLPLPASIVRTANWRLGVISYKSGNIKESIKFYKNAVTFLEQERASLDNEALRMGFVSTKQDLYIDLVELLIKDGDIKGAFEYAERAKSRTLVEVLATRNIAKSERSTGLFSDTQYRWISKSGLAALDRNEGKINAQEVFSVSQPIRIREAESLVRVEPISADEVISKIGAKEVVLEYFGHSNKLFVFKLDRQGIQVFELDAAPIQTLLTKFSKELTNSKSRNISKTAESLYRQLVLPTGFKPGDYELLTVIPHGNLHYIPFGALLHNKVYLSALQNLRILPNASTMLFQTNERLSTDRKALVFGNPDLRDPTLDLPGAEAEVKAISSLLKQPTVRMRSAATESEFRKLAPAYDTLHLAMHGKFDPKVPMSSGLYMTSDEAQDGILTAAELYDLELSADLVVLSACETGLTDISKGDDIVGLTRGFLFAGARSLVSSLWEVDDAVTKELMTEFYRQLARNKPVEALRLAQIKVMKRNPHPYYWAAFQVAGQN